MTAAGPQGLLAAMEATGLSPRKDIAWAADGDLVRYQVAGDKAGSKNGWVVLHATPGSEWASFGSWRTGEQHTWQSVVDRALSPAERAERKRQQQASAQVRASELAKVQASARDRAARLWGAARPASDSHPYLQRKRVHACGIRQLRDMLMIPARDAEGTTHTAQFIAADGTKRFMTGGRITGCYFAIGRPVDRLLLAEGYATAATLFEATGFAVAVCFNCGNLEAVARSIRQKFPGMQIVVVADNDVGTPGNPGVTKARLAAKAVGGLLAVPRFEGLAA